MHLILILIIKTSLGPKRRCLKPKGQFPGDSCNKYVNCWDGVATEQTCPEGLLFNAAAGYCDYPGNFNCQQNEKTSAQGTRFYDLVSK